jgi:AAA+ superfamily predicted ATPase
VRVVRYLRDISARFQTRKHNLILLSPSLNVHPDLEKQIAVIDWSLPDVKELEAILSKAESNLPNTTPVTLNGNRDQVIQAMRGLTEEEAENVLTAGVVACGELGDGVISHIIAEKKQIIRKSGVLEYFEANVSMSDVGGLDNLKEYAARKRLAMSPKARAAGVDSPKGVLLVGVPGTGKSLSAKAIAGGTLPLLRFDMSKILGSGRVGAAENNISTALKVAEATAPCVLWLDEIEKALADNGGASDGGVMMRVIGSLLTWMQETTSPVYVIATANSVSALRPELLSRFDDVMFVDLPDAESRLEILDVHMGKRGVTLNAKDFGTIVTATWGFSGREIEKVVKFAVERAFFDQKPVDVVYLLEAANQIVPTSETKKEDIKALREWAKGKALVAGKPLEAEPKAKTSVNRTMEV